MNASSNPPHTFLSGSAIDLWQTPSANFLYRIDRLLSRLFYQPALPTVGSRCTGAASDKTRVCLIRTGTVFSPEGGALKKILPLYRCGLGGKT